MNLWLGVVDVLAGVKYIISYVLRDDKIISITIRKDGNVSDSYCILSNSLKKLGKDFNVKT